MERQQLQYDPAQEHNDYERCRRRFKFIQNAIFFTRLPFTLVTLVILMGEYSGRIKCDTHLLVVTVFWLVPSTTARWVLICSIRETNLVKL